ncbi:MAG TPA: FAD:protein FMN transferase [Gammaproteobacteria bacterium]|nr:FAD:protein FMN transferase [Gammaproteobacteria bacterium]
MKRLRYFLGAVACIAAFLAHGAWVGERIDLMGTSVSVELWDEDEARGERLVDAVIAEYRRIDALMSTYKDSSEISLVNANAAVRPVRISTEMFDLIGRSQALSRRSRGAFDISYESVGYLYDFRARQRPDDAQIEAALNAIDYRSIVLDDAHSTVAFARPGMRINLGGIAKGYAVEHAAGLLRSQGVEHALLNAGGDTRVLGDRRGQPWVVGIRHPRAAADVITRLPLVDEAVSTSGDYERFFEEGGERYHHIINPGTGRPTDELMSVTVVGPDAVLTDGLSTTLFVLGMDQGLALVETYAGYEAIVVDRDGVLRYSSGLAEPQ